MRRDAFGVDHGFIRRPREVQRLHTSKSTEVGPKRRPCSLAGSVMDLALAITIILPGPFVHTMSTRGMGGVAAMITLPLVGVERRAASGDVVSHQVAAGVSVRMVVDPPALLARVPRDDADEGRASVRIRAMPCALIGAPAWGIGGVAMW
jgi:hypothetical protein